MSRVRRGLGEAGRCTRWLPRGLSIVVSGAFLLILALAVGNEDKPQGVALLVLAVLVLTIGTTFAAWRWEKVGGLVVMILSLCLGAASYSASLTSELGSLSLLLAALYGFPFLVVGSLFWIGAQRTRSGSDHNPAPPMALRHRWWLVGALVATAAAITVAIVGFMTGVRLGG